MPHTPERPGDPANRRPPHNPRTAAIAARDASRPFPGLPLDPPAPPKEPHGWTLVDPPRWEERQVGIHRHPPRSPVEDSYATQWYRLRGGFDLHPVLDDADGDPTPATPGEDGDVVDPWPLDVPGPVYLLTGWNPPGRGTTHAKNRTRQDRLRDRVSALGARVAATMAAVADDWSWAEEVLAVVGLDDDQAVTLAGEEYQVAVVRWDATALTVIPTGRDPHVPRSVAAWRASGPAPGCALSGVESLCCMHGGPWTSSSIHAAAAWVTHRRLLLGLLGCDVCRDGAVAPLGPGGGPISLSDMLLGSRHGGYAYRR